MYGFEIPEIQNRKVCGLKFILNSSNLLLSSSWDGSVRLYELTQKKCIMKTETKPPISCAATVI